MTQPTKFWFTNYALGCTAQAYLHLDSRMAGVVLPAKLMEQPHIVLHIGHAMANPIPDLTISAIGVSATLSFNQQTAHCVIPWEAIFAITDGEQRGHVWEESLPAEMMVVVENGGKKLAPRQPPPPSPPSGRGHLRLVK